MKLGKSTKLSFDTNGNWCHTKIRSNPLVSKILSTFHLTPNKTDTRQQIKNRLVSTVGVKENQAI